MCQGKNGSTRLRPKGTVYCLEYGHVHKNFVLSIDSINAERSLRNTISFYLPDKLDVIQDYKVHKTMIGIVLCTKRPKVTLKCIPYDPMNTLYSFLVNMPPKRTSLSCALTSLFSLTYNATVLQVKTVEISDKGVQ